MIRANDSAGEHIARFDYSAVWFLVFGAIAGSFGGIFVKIAEESLSPEATIFIGVLSELRPGGQIRIPGLFIERPAKCGVLAVYAPASIRDHSGNDP